MHDIHAENIQERIPMRTQIYALMSLLTVAMLASTTASHSFAADIVFLGEKGSPTQALDTIDHTTWSVLLARYVDSDGRVDYRRWKANANDMRLLDAYLIRLSSGDPQSDSTREARLAFWINAYNAVTVRGILREYPTTSIRNHTAKLWGYNIWKHLQLYVGGRAYSLDQIEHDVLRNMQEPRIHFAIVCRHRMVARGCWTKPTRHPSLTSSWRAMPRTSFRVRPTFNSIPPSSGFVCQRFLIGSEKTLGQTRSNA